METETDQTPKQKIEAACAELGLTMTAEFVPFSKSRNAKPREDGKVWRSLNWKVSLIAGTASGSYGQHSSVRAILTTDYAAGEANCPSYKNGQRRTKEVDDRINYELETGKAAKGGGGNWGVVGGKPILPELADVIASLVMDASVIDASTFEEWARDLGYDTDSRKAEATYRACLETALKLRNGVGEAGLAKLRDACQDY